MKYPLLILIIVISTKVGAQQLQHIIKPQISYALIISDSDFTSYQINMHITNVADTFYVAMVKHFEYDDRFWRFIKNFKVFGRNSEGEIIREDSALWRVITTGNEATVTYTVKPPALNGTHGSWRPFVASNGALVGGPQSFLYIVGYTQIPSVVTLQLPATWMVATGLQPASNANTFIASSVYELINEPILVGKLNTWHFTIDGMLHAIAYYASPGAKTFDSTLLINEIKKVTEQVKILFSTLPYSHYTFQLIDASYGGLEHCNSVTLAVRSDQLAAGNDSEFVAEMAHEYFHTWNLVRIRPAEYGDVTYTDNPLAKELWWSEGVTMLYADLLLRRAGLPVYEANRIQHLEQLISTYYSEPGNMKISPEKVSLAANGEPDMLGDYSASIHLQGELLGDMLDLIIRNATANRRNIDDVMRSMMQQFGKGKGFTNTDIEATITAVCNCNVHSFFQHYIYGSETIDFNAYLKLAGLSSSITWKDAKNADGTLAADLHIYSWKNSYNKTVLGISNPESCWGKAGLHTGDEVVAINNKPINAPADFFNILGKVNTGDTVTIQVKRAAGVYTASVIVSNYKTAAATIREITTATQEQQLLRKYWLAGR